MRRPRSPDRFLTPEERGRIETAIARAEGQTSAEIKVHLDRFCWGDIAAKAVRAFRRLGLHRTRQRNAVLFYLVTTNRQFSIYADEGIYRLVPPGFWDEVRDRLAAAFRQDRFADGLVEAVQETGKRLAHFFPRRADDLNEIPDEVTIGE